jgi:hypothetical protein
MPIQVNFEPADMYSKKRKVKTAIIAAVIAAAPADAVSATVV